MPKQEQNQEAEKMPVIDVVKVPPADTTAQAAAGQRHDEATGEQVKLARNPEEIAKAGTKLALAGDAAAGGNVYPAVAAEEEEVPAFGERVYATDRDVTVRYRNDPDPFTFDCVVSQ